MVDRRFESYSRLWELLEDTGPWRRDLGYRPIELEERKDLYNKMTDWYFEKATACSLSQSLDCSI
jgi:hypothetical protein